MPEALREPQHRRGPAARRWSLLTIAAAAAALALWGLWPSQPPPPATAAPPDAAGANASKPPQAAPAVADRPALQDRAPDAAPARAPTPSGAALPQGLRGRVVDAEGVPVGGVAVHLTESPGNDPVLMALAPQRRHLLAPLTSTRSADDGTFSLGLRVAEDRSYDVYVRSDEHAVVHRAGLRLLPGSWHDLGDLTLEEGATLRGRVTVAGRPQLPAPGAVVRLTAGGAFADEALRALPGGAALVAHTDADGYYELPHAPTRGVAEVSARAPGFARVTRRDVELRAGEPVVVDFALPSGATLVGAVRASDGTPLPGAQLTAWPAGPDATPLRGVSDAQGAFTVDGLQPGSRVRVEATAEGFAPAVRAEVDLSTPLTITLRRLHRVLVRAETPRGAVLRSYRLALRRFFPAEGSSPAQPRAALDGHLGALREVPERRVQLAAGADDAEVLGVPNGRFVVEVQAPGWAKTLSAPFELQEAPEADIPPQRIRVVVNVGVTLRGRVVDARGRALAGATVTTQAAGTLPDNPMLAALQRATPARFSRRTATTDERGWFTLERLACARYQLQIEHPDACRRLVSDIVCNTPSERGLGDIALRSGAVVMGTARRQGQAAGQIRVILTTSDAAPADHSLRIETVTDGEGAYAFPRRIAPGDYVLRCAEVGRAGAESEIFQQMVQLKKSTKTFSVAPGQEIVEQHLIVPAN